MAYLEFDPSDYSVTFQSDTITLLAKEYALLQFLYRHAGQAFTREQLLDQVWPMEYPGERTVDDHVYRLRKKLKRWSARIQLGTVRGLGYSLALKGAPALAVPSLTDSGLQKQIRQLLDTYQMLGQSKAMLALANQQELLGVSIDSLHLQFLRFVQADLKGLMHAAEADGPGVLYWLLASYYSYYHEPQQCLKYFEHTIQARILPYEMHRELELLNILGLYADNGRTAEDLERVQKAYRVIDGLDGELDSFRVHIASAEMYIHLKAKDAKEAGRCAAAIEAMLAEAPYLREICTYYGLKGRLLLLQGRRSEAAAAFEHGLVVGEEAHNMPLLVHSIIGTLDFLENVHRDPLLQRKFRTRLNELDRIYNFTANKLPMEQLIERILGSV
ncbi:winged helix-turn-helix domain-containing protein [Paenibacillus chibensis]|uniref:winged helix-turn-helix domain-containing protein n=1 Tax=Paenibacillus chibensis TaxID=59846 RepID=UPI0013E3A89B|nr:winged helix-turn-helix domain-containing protein [Paenibacillus chibensis]MEC0369609.1 winged helix-turn-helix domain-containing protein [Paenibacillus chibensis]